MQRKPKTFAVGQVVTWAFKITDNPDTHVKCVCEVVEVVCAGMRPDARRYPELNKAWMEPRPHESYIVHLEGRGAYWPQLKHLRATPNTALTIMPAVKPASRKRTAAAVSA